MQMTISTVTALACANIVFIKYSGRNSVELTARFVLEEGISLAEVLFSGKSKINQIV